MGKFGTPFGQAGIRVLLGLENDAHYGFNNYIFDMGGGKWTVVYRKAANHAATNGAEVWAFDTFDKGLTRENERVIYSDPTCDTRNFVCRKMANGRLGIIASRRTAALAYLAPVFIYSDNGGIGDANGRWDFNIIPAPASGWGVNFHGSMTDFPASVGGDDVNGFLAYSYGHTGGHIDACYTTTNGNSWAWKTQAAVKPASVPSLTEMACARVGTQDKWIMLVRPSGEIDDPAIVFTTTDPLTMGAGISAGIGIAGNPPQVVYDPRDNRLWYMAFARRDRGWKRAAQKGLENVFLVACADADTLYAAGGSMAALGLDWEIGCYLPDWASGYGHPVLTDGEMFMPFVCGEQYPDHGYSKLCLIGGFPMSGLDAVNIAWMMQWQGNSERITVRDEVEIGFGTTPPTQRGFLTLQTDSIRPGMSFQTFTTSARVAARFTNNAGIAGQITMSGSTVTYGT